MKVWIQERGTTCQEISEFSSVLYNHTHPPIQQKSLLGRICPLWGTLHNPGLQDASHITMYTLNQLDNN